MRAQLTRWLPNVGFGALVAICFLVPVVFTRQAAEAFMVPKVTVLWLGLIASTAGAVAWGLATRTNPLPPRSRAVAPVALLLAATAVATVASVSPILSLLGRYSRYDGLLGLVGAIALATLVVAYCWRAPERLLWLMGAFVASAGVGFGYVAIQQLGWDWIDWFDAQGNPILVPYGLQGNSNFTGAHLALAVPMALALRLHLPTSARRGRIALLGLAGLLLLGVWWTGTRGGALAAGAGIAAATWLHPGVAPRAIRWGATAATVLGLAAVLTVAVSERVPGDLAKPGSFLSNSTLVSRVDLWQAAASMAAEDPLTGVGPDAYLLRYYDVRPPLPIEDEEIDADEAHNVFLDRAATSGLIALGAFVWLLGRVGRDAWRARRPTSARPDGEGGADGEPQRALLLAGFGGAGAGYVVQGLTSIDAVPLVVVAWVSLGALVVLADPRVVQARTSAAAAPAPTAGRRARPLPVPALAIGGVVVVALVVAALQPLRADLAFRRGIRAQAAGRPAGIAAADYRRATELLPTEGTYHVRLGDQLALMAATETGGDGELATRFADEALLAYDHALEHLPGEANILRAKASTEVLLARTDGVEHLDRAEAIYRDLLARTDTDSRIYRGLGELAEVRAQLAEIDDPEAADRWWEEAGAMYEESFARYDGSVEVMGRLARVHARFARWDEAEALLERALGYEPWRTELTEALEEVRLARDGG